jgi:hypothetical protein
MLNAMSDSLTRLHGHRQTGVAVWWEGGVLNRQAGPKATICISKEEIGKSKIDPGKSPSACRVVTRLKLEVYGSN